MKCPGCGAEVKGKVCEYCGSESPQDKRNNENNGDRFTEWSCPRCKGSKISFSREKIGTVRKTGSRVNSSGRVTDESISESTYRTVGICQQCGYTWTTSTNTYSETAGKETAVKQKNKNNLTWLWVIGWIFIFPVPLTVLMLRKKDMDPILRYGVIAAGWIVYFIIFS